MTEPVTRLQGALAERYRIERPLGAGGMATVYLATDLKHDRQVALKVLRPELGAVLGTERFLAEIKITARLDHPHILTLIDSGAEGGFLYYVLPLVRGESLRDKLDREKQLSVEEALAITGQVASALDYAHRHGVIHRDIKPENILLLEGEAMLADFGIALAVKEAGGNRLTETGLSLGTPQYMSPEQATGDRQLDARSDLYSLAAVLYEMLAGEPPVTGPNAQAMIAKLMTERPIHLRVVRGSVPEAIDAAVARALDKTPADRFASAGDFAKALVLPPAHETAAIPSAVASSRRMPVAVLAGIGVLLVGAVAFFFLRGHAGPNQARISLRDRTQLTYTGTVNAPSLSPDGKQLAYFVKSCAGTSCTYAIQVQDVGATATRELLAGATAAYGLGWSEDRRNLLANMTIGGRFGTYLVSALGGSPRYLTSGVAAFFAGGDSLFIGPSGADSVFIIRIAPLNGAIRDSIVVAEKGQELTGIASVPGTARLVTLVVQNGRGLWQVVDRDGTVTDRLLNSCTCGGVASHDALWMQRAGPTASEAVVRVALDPATGRLGKDQDTVYYGTFTGLSVTADGTRMVVDDGSFSFSAMTAALPAMLKGSFPAGPPLLSASSRVMAQVSTDGARLLLVRTIPAANGMTETRLSVSPWEGGTETPVTVPGRLTLGRWSDSVTLDLAVQRPGGTRLLQLDVRTGSARNSLDLADSVLSDATALPAGWAWVPASRDTVVVQRGGARTEIPKPKWFSGLNFVRASPDGRRLLIDGWGQTEDSLRVDVVSVDGGATSPWFTAFAESGGGNWLADGSILFSVWTGQETLALLHLTAPGQAKRLGAIPHAVTRFTASADLKRAAFMWREYRGDAWLYRVVRP